MSTRRLSRFTRKAWHQRSRRRSKKQRGGNASFTVRYGSIRVNGQELESSQTQTMPQVRVPEGHTLIMVDPDAPAGTWLHWLRNSKQDLVPYSPPNPPSGTHRYIVRLVEGSPLKIPEERAPIDPAVILPGRVKGEVMFTQSKL